MSSTTLPASPLAVPLLRDGEAMTREEFERRWDAMPELRNAELIDGVVRMPSPVHHVGHSRPHMHSSTWLGVYEAATPGVEAGSDGSVRLALDSMPQPDNILIVSPSHGGRTRISADDHVEGGPELALEVAAATARLDRSEKLRLYRRNGVQEYVVCLPLQRQVEWHVLDGAGYRLLPPDADGILRSRVFPGLWLDAEALLRRDLARLLAVLQAGIASAEHAAFVARLATQAGASDGGLRPHAGP